MAISLPRISVALCTYNGALFLRDQLKSILKQSYSAYEIIIIDDCSTDDTLDIIREFAYDNSTIKYFENEHNLGFIRNFSLAISKTSGDYVALADQDDIWTEDHLETLLQHIGRKAVCVGDAMMIDADGVETGTKYSEIKQNYYIPPDDVMKAYRIVYNYNPYQGASMLVDRKWVENYLPISPRAGFHDTFLIGCASLTKGVSVIPNIVTKYRIHEGQVTKKWKVSIWDEIKHLKHHIYFPSKEYFINYVTNNRQELSIEALGFIEEFQHIQALDRQNKRLQIIRIMNSHYKEIYSCLSYKYRIIRSLHFLLSF